MKVSDTKAVDALFKAGAHYAYPKARRHPSHKQNLFGAKGGVELFDLEKTAQAIARATEFIEALGASGKQILFAGSKLEARGAVKSIAESINAPYVAGRWVGGTFSNFALIKKRVDSLETLSDDREKGTLTKYTKLERLMIDRKIKRLDETFGGLRGMRSLPSALIVVDPRHEKNAIAEAKLLKIPVVAIANSDCDVRAIKYPIPANDSNRSSITYVLSQLAEAYREGAKRAPARVVEAQPTKAPVVDREERPARRPARG